MTKGRELQALTEELERRKRPFAHFVERHNPTMLTYEHIPRMVSAADRLVRGEITRLLIIAPPRYLKSEIFSRLLPAYYLRRHPGRNVALSSYVAELAWDLSETAKNYYMADGGKVATTSTAKKHWKTGKGGGMLATGVGGPLLGHGYQLGVVDDPTDPEKAVSPTYQRKFPPWWSSKWLSRQDGEHAVIVAVMQRLGVGDPIDYLFRAEVGEHTELAQQCWHVVLCDEIKSDEPLGRWSGPMGLPPTCTLEPDPREVGEVLAPSLLSVKTVQQRQQEAGPYTTASQRQGRPMRPKGDFWQKPWFTLYDVLPADAYDGGKDWDTAYTEDENNAASAWVETYRGLGAQEKFPIYIHDLDWRWLKFPELVSWMSTTLGPHYVEDKATGKSCVQALNKYGIAAAGVPVHGDKFTRAAAAQPAVAQKRVFVRREVLDTLLFGEGQGLLRITAEGLQGGMVGLDLNDCFVQALHRHLKLSEKPQKVRKEALFA